MKCFSLLLFITIFGFSVGDELGFPESFGNSETNRRRSAQVSKMQAQLIKATQEQQEQKKAKFVNPDKVISSRSVSTLPASSVELMQASPKQIVPPLALGSVHKPDDSHSGIPPFKPIPPAAERPSITKSISSQPALMGIAFPAYNTMPSSYSKFSVGSFKNPVDPPVAKVMAVVAVPKKKPSQVASDRVGTGFSDRVLTLANNEVDKPVPQHSSNSLQALLSAHNVTEEALELALLQRQQLVAKMKSKTTTTTTKKPATSKYANSVGKVMNAPKEYYPVGYDKNFDDNFAARVELPDTSFYCGDQKHFPGLYADEDLGCMVFHVCALTDDGLIMKSFLCPESTLFDQAVLKCNWWFYVDCKNSKKLYDSNIPISKSYQLMKALTFFSAYKKDIASTTTSKPSED